MRRERQGIAAAATACALVGVLGLTLALAPGCAKRVDYGELELTGVVLDDRIELQVPALPTPVLNVTAGMRSVASTSALASAPPAASTGAGASSGSSSAPRTRVTSVPVEPGDVVQAGDVLVVLDQAALEAALRSAQTAAVAASASVDVLDARLGKAATTASDLASQTAAIDATIAQLTTTRATLDAQLTAAQSMLDSLNALPPSVPTTPTPGTPTPEEIAAQKQQLEAVVASLTVGIPKLDEGITEAEAARAKLQSGQTQLTDAQALLYSLRDLAAIASETASLGVEVAQIQLDMATIRAPEAGMVLETARVGDVLAAGAPVAALRRQASQQVETWIDESESDLVALGQAARVSIDSRPGETYWAQVTLVDAGTGFPPTSHSTDVIHMIRAVRVRVALDDATVLPAGTPADVTISTR